MSNGTTNTEAGGHLGGFRAEMLIELSEVTRRYAGGGGPALDRVSLSVAQGEAAAVMGPSGSGKSTLLVTFAATGASLTAFKWLETGQFDDHDLVALQRHRDRVTVGPVPPGPVSRWPCLSSAG